MRIKGIKVMKREDGTFVVTPLYWSKRGGTRQAFSMRERGGALVDVMASVLGKLVARGDLKG